MHPGHRARGVGAICSLLIFATVASAQPPGDRWKDLEVSTTQDFVRAVQAVSLPLDEWIQRLNQEPVDFLCIGERHEPPFRAELARQLFSTLKTDVLFLEAVPNKAQNLTIQVLSMPQSPPTHELRLLGAPIGPLLSQALKASPHLRILGVEQTAEQKRELNLLVAQGDRNLSRDSYIARNILDEMKSGLRHVALYGANHCAKISVDSGWMKPFLPMLIQARPESRIRSVKVILEPERGPFSSDSAEGQLMIQLSAYGLADASFAITDTSKLKPEVYNSKVQFLGLFSAYDVIVYLKRSR